MKPVLQAVENFFKTTTLHGFKYLVSPSYHDRVGWVLGCIASACCAGVLCVVLWERYMVVPALLQLGDLTHDSSFQSLPTVAFCQPPITVTKAIIEELQTNGMNTSTLPAALANAVQGKPVDEAKLDLLEKILKLNNANLLEMLLLNTPECSVLIRNCRWRDVPVDCARLFKKEMTSAGVCCVATPTRFSETIMPVIQRIDLIKKLEVGLQCADGSDGFEFFTKYSEEDRIVPTHLSPGSNYIAQLSFTSERDYDDEKLIDVNCVTSKDYSRDECLLECKEKRCGCLDPFRISNGQENEDILPPCPLNKLPCLSSVSKDNKSCSCLPPCHKIITQLVMEQGLYKLMQSGLDTLYSGLNSTHSLTLRLRININASKLFILKPTETWLTLLSSLGGVFNMFLGVGLFSALEFLFLLFVKIPMALRRSTEIVPVRRVMFDEYH